ncbi:TPA: hypothetical protein DDW35_11395 [Candidatus Sumerlaeota bacterium]|nr:hypothetical protein [Candidatus Sumerlaeota bacterium]
MLTPFPSLPFCCFQKSLPYRGGGYFLNRPNLSSPLRFAFLRTHPKANSYKSVVIKINSNGFVFLWN